MSEPIVYTPEVLHTPLVDKQLSILVITDIHNHVVNLRKLQKALEEENLLFDLYSFYLDWFR